MKHKSGINSQNKNINPPAPMIRNLASNFLRKTTYLAFICVVFAVLTSCDAAKDVLEVALKPPQREPIDIARTGINSFFVTDGFGSVSDQYSDIRNNLKLKYVRVLFAWVDSIQASPESQPNFSLYDKIVEEAPSNVRILVVVAHSPNWLTNSSNWEQNNPRITWVNKWLKTVVTRYKDNPKIEGYEIFNEPDAVTVAADASLGLTDPDNYFELLSYASSVVKSVDPGKLIVSAATESINQSFPSRLDYNTKLIDLGAANLVDVWAIHYYGEQYERVVQAKGVRDLLVKIPKPIWVTESGAQGVTSQISYVERTWPFLQKQIPNITRFYYYDYSSSEDPSRTFSLRTRSSQNPVSDLYVYLAGQR